VENFTPGRKFKNLPWKISLQGENLKILLGKFQSREKI
jgi:hypothetical protein